MEPLRKRVTQLKKCDFPNCKAEAYDTGRKRIARCTSSLMSIDITNKMLNKSGLLSLTNHYKLVNEL